jgi:saxitoxin biosynthesis operon SxtJ-like protein
MEGRRRLETGIPARLTPAEGRKFGLTVGAAFLAIAVIIWWRGKHATYPYFGGLGALLVLAGLLIPGKLGPVYRAWMGLAHLLSRITTPIFMGVVYFLVITPIGLLMRLVGRKPLVHPSHGSGFWHDAGPQREAAQMKRQF